MSQLRPNLPAFTGWDWPSSFSPSNSQAALQATETRRDSVVAGPRWANRYRNILRVTDALVIVGAIGIALVARFGTDLFVMPPSAPVQSYAAIAVIVLISWLTVLGFSHTRGAKVVGAGAAEYRRVTNASALTFGLLAVVFLLLQVDIARSFFLLTLPLGLFGLLLGRWLWRRWLTRERVKGHFLSRAVVIGGAEDVKNVLSQLAAKPWAAFHVVGVAIGDEVPAKLNVREYSVPIVASLNNVVEAVDRLSADTVIVAGRPAGGSDYIQKLSWQLEGFATELVLANLLADVAGPRIHFRPVEGLPLIHVDLPQFEGGKHVLKRGFDILASGLALVFLAPLMIILAALIKADSSGPIIFRQERVGRGGERFQMLKFRSMIPDAEAALVALQEQNQGAGLLFKMKEDPRITKLGRVLRKYSLDEVPQLWNILIGNMSLVGPRPPLPQEVDGYEEHVNRRLYIKPGLTGMWQVSGRSDLSWDQSVQLDLYYVENWSLTGDLMLIWRTVKVVLKPVGAY